MIYNEILQWLLLGLLLWRLMKHERTLNGIITCFTVLNQLMQTIKEELDDSDEN